MYKQQMITVLLSFVLIFSSACSAGSRSFVYNPKLNGSSMMARNSYDGHGEVNDQILDPEFEKEDFTDKTGYVILGLAIAAGSAAAIAIPIYLYTK